MLQATISTPSAGAPDFSASSRAPANQDGQDSFAQWIERSVASRAAAAKATERRAQGSKESDSSKASDSADSADSGASNEPRSTAAPTPLKSDSTASTSAASSSSTEESDDSAAAAIDPFFNAAAMLALIAGLPSAPQGATLEQGSPSTSGPSLSSPSAATLAGPTPAPSSLALPQGEVLGSQTPTPMDPSLAQHPTFALAQAAATSAPESSKTAAPALDESDVAPTALFSAPQVSSIAPAASAPERPAPISMLNPEEFAQGLSGLAVRALKEGGMQATLRVTPEALGPLRADISISKLDDGANAVSMTLTLAHPQALEAARESLEALQQSLAAAGMPQAQIALRLGDPVAAAGQSSAMESSLHSGSQNQNGSQGSGSQSRRGGWGSSPSDEADDGSWRAAGLFDRSA